MLVIFLPGRQALPRGWRAEVASDKKSGEGDVCVVTGGGGGLGVAVCRALAQAGTRVVAVDIGEFAAKAAKLLKAEGLITSPATCDVADSFAVNSLRDDLLKTFGRIDALFNLAGVVRNDKLVDVVDADFDLTIASHAKGTLNMMRAFAPSMKERKYGRIVNTSSVAALGSTGGTSYSAAKGAIEGMTRTAAVELARYGITVNCIAPGVINSGMFQQQPERAREHMLARTPMRRGAEPSELAACYRFLGSKEASYVTGQTLFVCGGASIGAFN
jgi:3-oxoacyl-[acyl-carrier protein] reductase